MSPVLIIFSELPLPAALHAVPIFGKTAPDNTQTGRIEHLPALSTYKLLTDTQFLNQSTISLDICLFEVIQKTSSLTYHLKKSTSGVMILVVCLEMLCKLFDSLCKDSYLYLR